MINELNFEKVQFETLKLLHKVLLQTLVYISHNFGLVKRKKNDQLLTNFTES